MTPSIPQAEIERAAQLYAEGVASGCVPMRGHVGVGKESAVTYIERVTGWSRSGARRRLELAQRQGLIGSAPNPHMKPRYRVRADGSIVPSIPRTEDEERDRQAAQQGYAPDFDLTHTVPDGMTLKGTSIRYDGAGEIQQYWNKTRLQGADPAEVVQLPDPKKIIKTSTLYDQAGRVTQQWVSERPEDHQRESLWQAFADGLSSELPRTEPIPAPDVCNDDLLAAYPVGDQHLGMLAWGEETGSGDYDLSIGEQLLIQSMDYLINAAPEAATGLIAFLGDLMHYDGMVAQTPTSRNPLDSDSRFPKIVRATMRTVRYLIAAALKKHQKVHVIFEFGNHDPASTAFLIEAMRAVYENEPRVEIDPSPSHYHYFEFGRCLVGTHHGDGAKMDDLPQIMANDRPEAWGRTRHRCWWTGHIHHRKSGVVVPSSKDGRGCSVESFRILAPPDGWHAAKGYRAIQDMKGIVLHRELGEVSRHTANPQMFQVAA